MNELKVNKLLMCVYENKNLEESPQKAKWITHMILEQLYT